MASANGNIQVTDLDFINIKNNLKQFLQGQDTLKDYNYEGSALSVLLDLLAYNTQYNAYYLNMVANEMFLDTALLRSSVISKAKELNYTPKSAIAPTATVNLTVHQVNDSSLTVPKFTRFLSESLDGNYLNGEWDKAGWTMFKIDDVDGDGIDEIVSESWQDGTYNALKKINGVWKIVTITFGK